MFTGNGPIALVTIAALIFYAYTAFKVAEMRRRHSIVAPATTGAPEFERAFRVQMNTLENLIIFLPLLWLAGTYFNRWVAVILGIAWIAGRVLYMQGYMEAADKRETGALIQGAAMALLGVVSVLGILF
jgi:glutathione S-transferase